MSEVEYVTDYECKLFVTETCVIELNSVKAVFVDPVTKGVRIFFGGHPDWDVHLNGDGARKFIVHYFRFCDQYVPQHFLEVFEGEK